MLAVARAVPAVVWEAPRLVRLAQRGDREVLPVVQEVLPVVREAPLVVREAPLVVRVEAPGVLADLLARASVATRSGRGATIRHVRTRRGAVTTGEVATAGAATSGEGRTGAAIPTADGLSAGRIGPPAIAVRPMSGGRGSAPRGGCPPCQTK